MGSTHKVRSDDRQFSLKERYSKTLSSSTCRRLPHIQQAVRGSFMGTVRGGWGQAMVEGGQEDFSFQADEKEQDVVVPASLKR